MKQQVYEKLLKDFLEDVDKWNSYVVAGLNLRIALKEIGFERRQSEEGECTRPSQEPEA